MIRGTTAQYKFKLPYSYNEIQAIKIKFWQPGNPSELLPLFKYKHNCIEVQSNEICVSLRPSETALFSDKYKAKVQLLAQTYAGAPFGSKEQLISVYPNDIIMDDPDEPIIPSDGQWILLDGGKIIE